MKFLFLLTSVYLILSFISITSTNPLSSNPLVCEWKHINGKSGYSCPNGLFTNDEGELWGAVATGGYSMLEKKEPDEVMFRNWPIDIANVIKRLIEKINDERQIHRVGILQTHIGLANTAQERANKLANENPGSSIPISKTKGEITGYADKDKLSEIVQNWYNEKTKYNWNAPESNEDNGTNDFTQIVWKSSEKIGCGIANNGRNYYAVCDFYPPGNIPGRYADNVINDNGPVIFGFNGRARV